MALTPSTMLPLGSKAPAFTLPEPGPTGEPARQVSIDDFAEAPALLVAFLCNHCPYVKHVRGELASLVAEYQARGLAAVGISSNDVAGYPDDSPARMAEEKAAVGYTFPYLYDESQAVARAYEAACTPDFFVFGPDRTLAYRGRLDDSTPGNGRPVTGGELRDALEAVLGGREPAADQKPSMGCNIKWKAAPVR